MTNPFRDLKAQSVHCGGVTWVIQNGFNGEQNVEDIISYFNAPGSVLSYGIGSYEQGAEGGVHIQSYFQFHKKVTRKKLIHVLNHPKNFLTACIGNSEENIKYACNPEKTGYLRKAFEFGVMREIGRPEPGLRVQDAARDILDLALQHNLEAVQLKYPGAYVRSLVNLTKISLRGVRVEYIDTKRCFWFYGKTRTGKSRMARHILDRIRERDGVEWVDKTDTKFFDNSNGPENILLEDLDESHVWMQRLLKIWGDKYTHTSESKGSGLVVSDRIFIITSNVAIHKIFGVNDHSAAIAERFETVEVTGHAIGVDGELGIDCIINGGRVTMNFNNFNI